MDGRRFDNLARRLATQTTPRRAVLKGLAAGLASGLLAPVGAAGAGAKPGGAGKVVLCHKGRTTTVAQNSVDAHLARGDTLGPCAESCATAGCPPGADPCRQNACDVDTGRCAAVPDPRQEGVPCGEGGVCCGGACARLGTDSDCTACGDACAPGLCGHRCVGVDRDTSDCSVRVCCDDRWWGEFCPGGGALCPTDVGHGEVVPDLCVCLLRDRASCGTCGNACADPRAPDCLDGQCDCDPARGLDGDPDNCGGCGIACAPGQTCVGGNCQG